MRLRRSPASLDLGGDKDQLIVGMRVRVMLKINRAIISVSDKTNLLDLVKTLKRCKVEMISTGGTRKLLTDHGISSKSVSEETGFPEILDGRVKTLHPKIHGGLLFLRENAAHRKTAKAQGIKAIDMVVVNLYPFQETVKDPKTKFHDAIEQIDIGGPSLLRAGSKNYRSVAVLCDPSDYKAVIEELEQTKGSLSEKTLKRLAVKVFEHTAAYDAAIARYLRSNLVEGEKELPPAFNIALKRSLPLRYGENPHQGAALYRRVDQPVDIFFRQLHGKELSFNNILDINAVVDILREFEEPSASVVKHNNPCGISADRKLVTALKQAIECDPVSSFGGIVGVNRPLDQDSAALVLEKLPFFEVLVAPQFSTEALTLLKTRKNLRLIEVPDFERCERYDFRCVRGGVLVQEHDQPIARSLAALKKNLKVVTKVKLTAKELNSLLFAWVCAKVVRSNAIVLVQGKQTVGIGCGQMSRVDSVKIACEKAGERAEGSVLASDGFFPMPDNIVIAHSHQVKAIIQPGGSVRDSDVIQACDTYGISMVFTGERHFKH